MLMLHVAPLLVSFLLSPRAPAGRCGSARMAEGEGDGLPGAPSFEQFKKMMQTDVSPEKLTLGEQVCGPSFSLTHARTHTQPY